MGVKKVLNLIKTFFAKKFHTHEALVPNLADPEPHTSDIPVGPGEDPLASTAENQSAPSHDDLESDIQKIKRTEEFLRKSGLGEWFVEFLGGLGSRIYKAKGASEGNPVPGEFGIRLTGGGKEKGDLEWITFFYREHYYRVENKPQPISLFDDNDFRSGEGVLFCDGTEVLRLETKQYYGDEYFSLRYDRVLVFVRGDWTREIVQFLSQFDIERQRLARSLKEEAIRKQASGIKE